MREQDLFELFMSLSCILAKEVVICSEAKSERIHCPMKFDNPYFRLITFPVLTVSNAPEGSKTVIQFSKITIFLVLVEPVWTLPNKNANLPFFSVSKRKIPPKLCLVLTGTTNEIEREDFLAWKKGRTSKQIDKTKVETLQIDTSLHRKNGG